MNEILHKLQGGDLRSIGRSDEVVQDILNKPSRHYKWKIMSIPHACVGVKSFDNYWGIFYKKTGCLSRKKCKNIPILDCSKHRNILN